MANQAIAERRWSKWRLAWAIPPLLMCLPLMFNAPWTLGDFVFAGVLFGSVGLGIEFLVSRSDNLSYRLGAVLGLAAIFLTIWINGAVGMIGSEDNVYNLYFLAEIPIALLGSIAARFRARGMAIAMFVAGSLHIALGLLAALGLGGPVRAHEVVLTLLFAAPWLLSGGLFRKAAEAQPA